MKKAAGLVVACTILLSACGGSSDDPSPAVSDGAVPPVAQPAPAPPVAAPPPSPRGRLIANTPAGVKTRAEIDELTAGGLERILLRNVTGEADCDVELRVIEYETIGARGESTNATASVAVPRGDNPVCNGDRPLVLYAHGTDADRNYSTLTNEEVMGGVVLAAFAARGYLAVAPDYIGYGRSSLPYHPYLNAEAQAADMIDALRAARTTLVGDAKIKESKLFITGYSQGGHVAMATHKVMERDFPVEFPVAGSVPMSGPYALEHQLLETLRGRAAEGSNVLLPFLIDGFQRSYGDLFTQASEIYMPPYDTTAFGLFPGSMGRQEVIDRNLLPPNLLQSQGSPFLLKPEFVTAVLADPAQPVRVAFARNSLLDWAPRAPMALCGGNDDPVVFYDNTRLAEEAFAARGVRVVRYDFGEGDTIPGGTTSNIYLRFRALFPLGQNLERYHVALAPFCARLARDFFSGIQ